MDITIIAAAIIYLLQAISDDRRFNKEQRQAARVALSNAFHETEGYYAHLASGGSKDHDREHHIASLWEQTAILSEQFDPSLASRLGLKSRYWKEGAAWSDTQIADARIQLASIRRDANFSLILRGA